MSSLGFGRRCVWMAAAVLLLPVAVWAAGEGQKDYDEASEKQLTAESLGDLEKVITLCESAIKKGLDKEYEGIAKQLLASTLYQHAERSVKAIFEQQPPNPRWPLVRERAMKSLNRATEVDPKLPDAYLLIAKLQRLPNGDTAAAFKAVDKAIELLKEQQQPKQVAKALILRAVLNDDPEKRLADLDAAIAADPNAAEALQARAFYYLEKENFEKAIPDLAKLVERDPTNALAEGALAEALMNSKKFDDAITHADKLIKQAPAVSLGHNLKARILVLKEDMKGALESLNKALEIDRRDVGSLLLRSRVHAALEDPDKARQDVDQALSLRPDLPQAILIRSLLAAEKKRYGEAIADLQMLLRADPTNRDYRVQLAAYFVADQRPRKAIEILDNLVADNADDADVLRSRGDALLSISKHKEALADYESALKIEPDDSGILNNYAWVLATGSDKIRDGKKALELAKKACDLTEYKKPHILSTLASAYAENGDFENAVKWSTKAVEMSTEDIKEQLSKELDSYKEKKPWRESQNVEENKKPIDAKPDDLET